MIHLNLVIVDDMTIIEQALLILILFHEVFLFLYFGEQRLIFIKLLLILGLSVV